MEKSDYIFRAQMLRQNQYSNYKKSWVQTHILATRDPNHASLVLCNIKVITPRTNFVAQTTHIFEDNGQWIANYDIQEQKPASTKSGRGTVDFCQILRNSIL